MGLVTTWFLVEKLLLPIIRWFVRGRVERVLDEVTQRLRRPMSPFSLTKRQVLIDRLIYDPVVLESAAEFSAKEDVARQVAMAKVERYAKEIVPAFNAYIYFRVGYWLARRIAQSLYRVRVASLDERAMLSISEDATVVVVINHRSNMDYILVAYLVAERTTLSYAAGEWARIWPLETLMRAMGAYFVRRDSRNELYRTVLRRYVQMATEEGVTQALFPEGRLSRDGGLGQPKLGLLGYMLRDFDPERHRDIVFVPLGINYDRVLEDRTLLLDLDPFAERKRGFAAVATAFRFFAHNFWLRLTRKWYRYGYACVSAGNPLSIKEYLSRENVDFRGLDRESRFREIERLAEQLMSEVGRAVPVVPVALVSTVLVRDPERPLSQLEIKAQVQELIDRLESSRAHVYVPREDRDYAITVGLRMLTLRRVVVETNGLFTPVAEELPVLHYYANSVRQFLEPS